MLIIFVWKVFVSCKYGLIFNWLQSSLLNLTMTSLSGEQKLKIEENRKKALEIRALKMASTDCRQKSALNNCKNIPGNSTRVSNVPGNGHHNNFAKLNNVIQNGVGDCVNYKITSPSKQLNNLKVTNSPGKSKGVLPVQFYGNDKSVISVSCYLISKDRFCADVNYSKTVIDIFKTIPDKLYDPNTGKWSFPLSKYNDLKKVLKNSTYNIIIGDIPSYVLKVFDKSSRHQDYLNIDVSPVESHLLRNLYPFQLEGVQFGISKKGRCIVADDMGLGKTIQALGIAHYYYSDWPLLVVCPSSMRYRWEQEIITHLPNVRLTKLFVMSKCKDKINKPEIAITSYDLMSRTQKVLEELNFGTIIMDESHSMKSMKTNRTSAALSLIKKAKRCILLSGTPALSRPVELYPQMKAIEPHFMSLKEFGVRYCDGKQTKFGWDYSGSSNMDELKLLLEEKFMIRRLKSTVLKQLPPKIREVVILDPDKVKLNKSVMSAFNDRLNAFDLKGIEKRGTLLSYFAETSKTKINAVLDYINQLIEDGHKFLVFAHHREMMNAICNALENKHTYYIRIDGSTSSDERKSVCDQFQYEDKFRVAVLSITAASTGLTLTAAHLVVFAELFWNPGILTQAEDRVHRIGQEDSVLVQYLIANNTADDHLWPIIQSKLDTLNKAGLCKENFCDDINLKEQPQQSRQKTILDFFEMHNGDIDDVDEDLCNTLDAVEGQVECKRPKLE